MKNKVSPKNWLCLESSTLFISYIHHYSITHFIFWKWAMRILIQHLRNALIYRARRKYVYSKQLLAAEVISKHKTSPARLWSFHSTRNETYRGAPVISFLKRGTKLQGGPWSFYSLADCGGWRGQRSLSVGRGATFEKDRTGPPNAVPRRPAPGRTDCPFANTAHTQQSDNPRVCGGASLRGGGPMPA